MRDEQFGHLLDASDQENRIIELENITLDKVNGGFWWMVPAAVIATGVKLVADELTEDDEEIIVPKIVFPA